MEDIALRQAADIIRNNYDQSKNFLFGSHAKHSATGESDIDLCV
ncbi:MAG: nucleotidyltransferase domain-containing protein [Spirochaetales bacterium]|nr:nucleotidyltransferase domain-containing protein [Spirochaetales bacterium]